MSRKELNVLLDLLQHSRIHSRAFECDSPAGCEPLAGVSQCFLEPASSKAVQVYKPQSFQLLTRFFCRKTSSVQPIRCLSWDLSWTGSLSPTFSSEWDWQHCCNGVLGRVHFSFSPKSISVSPCRDFSWFVNMERACWAFREMVFLPTLTVLRRIYLHHIPLGFSWEMKTWRVASVVASWCFSLTLNYTAFSLVAAVSVFQGPGHWEAVGCSQYQLAVLLLS